jgi:PAS domain S-box-containing protein
MDNPSNDESAPEAAQPDAKAETCKDGTGTLDHAQLSAVLSRITDGVYIYDKELRICYANEAAAAFAGSTVEQLFGQRLADLLPDIVHSEFYKTFEHVMRTQQPEIVAAPYEFPDGRLRWFEVHAYPLPDGLVAIATDISERVKREEERTRIQNQILQAQKLESLGVLAGGIAHDFNNLLMSVLGYASLALSDIATDSPAYDNVRQVELAAQRAADLCKQMLAYSGRGHFVVQQVDLSRLVEDMGHLLMLAKSKNATLKYDLGTSLPRIEADANQLHQVLISLVTNASDAIGDASGVISVSTGIMDCDENYLKEIYIDEPLPAGTYVYLEVSDNGCGMSKEVKSKVFEPFFTTKFMGRGLGLAAVLGITRGHRGAIKIYTEPGRGTTMKVLLPVKDHQLLLANAPEEKEAAKQWKGSGTILVVDDESSVRTVTSTALRRVGFTVLEAKDGHEALSHLNEHQDEIRLVLLDVTMPRMGGEETYRRIRQITKDIPVILSSGYNEQDATGHFNGKGLSGFIQKPYRPTELIAKIRALLGE